MNEPVSPRGRLYQKMSAVLAECDSPLAAGVNVTDYLRPIFARHGLICIATVNEIMRPTSNTNHVRVGLTVTFADAESGGEQSLIWYGEAIDNSERCLARAYSYGMRTLLSAVFLLPEHDAPTPTNAPRQAPAVKPAPASRPAPAAKPTPAPEAIAPGAIDDAIPADLFDASDEMRSLYQQHARTMFAAKSLDELRLAWDDVEQTRDMLSDDVYHLLGKMGVERRNALGGAPKGAR